jgi:hypothetical protein
LNGSRSLLGFWTSKNGSPDAIEFGAGEVSLWRIVLKNSTVEAEGDH